MNTLFLKTGVVKVFLAGQTWSNLVVSAYSEFTSSETEEEEADGIPLLPINSNPNASTAKPAPVKKSKSGDEDMPLRQPVR
jgi:hypothetical protein